MKAFNLRRSRSQIKVELIIEAQSLWEKYIQLCDIGEKCRFMAKEIVRKFIKLAQHLFKVGGKFSAFLVGAFSVFFLSAGLI